jgi:hypothetical protein
VSSIDGTFRAATMTGGGQYSTTVRLRALSTVALKPASGKDFPLITLGDGTSEVTGIVLAVKIDHLSISGKVVDAAGGPVPDVRIVAELLEGDGAPKFWRGLQDPATTSDVDGRFTIDDLLDGTYALRARSSTGGEATLIGVRAGAKDLSLVLAEPGSIEGTIAGFATTPQISAILTASKAGQVFTAQTSNTAPVFTTPQGTAFALRNLTPGTYIVAARSASEAASATVVVQAGGTAHVTLTSKGSGALAGHVVDFKSRTPVEGMTCRAWPRVDATAAAVGGAPGVTTNKQGVFQIAAAPAGDIVIACDGLQSLYSDGIRLVTVQAGKQLDVEVPIVAWNSGVHVIAGLGADIDTSGLVPTLVRVEPGGPAAAAGLQNGDVITAVDDASVAELSPRGVIILIINRAPGTKVKLAVTRAGKTVTAEAVLGADR